ncbi:MAG: hypothetical protein HRT89_23100 [Lentisphaeria bacterium]|nr:hypothetical protein [Lentisphaeria bacterium]NQZ70948.1 hypothetical protein [Lentisphaeria bacterium]
MNNKKTLYLYGLIGSGMVIVFCVIGFKDVEIIKRVKEPISLRWSPSWTKDGKNSVEYIAYSKCTGNPSSLTEKEFNAIKHTMAKYDCGDDSIRVNGEMWSKATDAEKLDYQKKHPERFKK